MSSKFLSGLAQAYLRADALFERARQTALSVASSFFSTVLTIEEQSAISVRVYESAFRRQTRRELADWEKSWFARRLPPPPARVLVGAAGLGPEVLHLINRGYRVDALEPSKTAAAACAALGTDAVFAGRYEDLADAVLNGSQFRSEIATQRYDAVILGWGSLSHILNPEARLGLLAACDELIPNGPILASFLEIAQSNSSTGRAHTVGKRLGRIVRRARRRKSSSEKDVSAVAFGSWFGFIHLFTPEEVETLAKRIGRRVIWEAEEEPSGYPHVTFERIGRV